MIKNLVIYNTAICNLNCRYCFISKNPALNIVDKQLEASFSDLNYYPSFLKQIEDNGIEMDIHQLEIWGCETVLFLERIFPFVEHLINKYPNFNTIRFSSNYTTEKTKTVFKDLNTILAKYPTRNFTIES